MKQAVILIITILISISSYAEYEALQLYEMVIKADKIVYGEIVDLSENEFLLKTEGSLTSDTGLITVQKFKDWEDASRWTKYRIGQKVLLFIKEREGKNFVMSGGNEGELPIVEDKIYISGFSIPLPPPPSLENSEYIYFETENYKNIFGGVFWGTKLDFFDFMSTLSKMREYYDFEYGKYNSPSKWKLNCKVEEILNSKNKILIWTYNEMKRDKNER